MCACVCVCVCVCVHVSAAHAADDSCVLIASPNTYTYIGFTTQTRAEGEQNACSQTGCNLRWVSYVYITCAIIGILCTCICSSILAICPNS